MKKKTNPFLKTAWVLAILSSMLVFSCQNEAKINLKKVFHYNQLSPISSLDPAFARSQANMWAIQHLFDALLEVDDSLQIKPSLATRWEISKDGLTYTFHLKPNVFFHDSPAFGATGKGRKMTAADVAYSFGRLLDSTVNSPGSWVFKGRVRVQDPFVAVNDSIFELHLAKPFRPMLGILTMQYCSIVPKEAVSYFGKDFRKNPVGTGAFRFKKWLENQGLFLTKNEIFHEFDESGARLPYLDGVRTSFMTDRKTAYLEMMRGRLDFMSGIESSIAGELLTQEGELHPKQFEKLKLIKSPYLNSEYLGINMAFPEKTSALAVKKVRQALNFGFDRVTMLRVFRNSMGKPAASGFSPRGLPNFDSTINGYYFDRAKAQRLLTEAGFPNGKNLPEIKLICNKDYLDLCTFMVRQWEELGIKAKVDVMETATMREMMTKGTAQFFRASWIADYPDSESFFTVFYSKNPAPPNYTRFKNARFDELYEKALEENDDKKRYEIYRQMELILIDEAPVIFLFYDESSRFCKKNIDNMSFNSMNLLPLKRVKKN
ncbi:MAG: hypothetical protein RL757_244 [Bacteroidota bacterium]|jgi:peptide/nickel transport system substrate-binding protein